MAVTSAGPSTNHWHLAPILFQRLITHYCQQFETTQAHNIKTKPGIETDQTYSYSSGAHTEHNCCDSCEFSADHKRPD